jgi:hypothetical protein
MMVCVCMLNGTGWQRLMMNQQRFRDLAFGFAAALVIVFIFNTSQSQPHNNVTTAGGVGAGGSAPRGISSTPADLHKIQQEVGQPI